VQQREERDLKPGGRHPERDAPWAARVSAKEEETGLVGGQRLESGALVPRRFDGRWDHNVVIRPIAQVLIVRLLLVRFRAPRVSEMREENAMRNLLNAGARPKLVACAMICIPPTIGQVPERRLVKLRGLAQGCTARLITNRNRPL
jgi:hypothetical protein